MSFRLINLGISSEQDMVAVRQRAREISAHLDFSTQDQVRIATAVSELARTTFAHAAGGHVEFLLDHLGSGASLLLRIKSSGGDFKGDASVAPAPGASATGVAPARESASVTHAAGALEAALASAQRLMDECIVDAGPGPSRVITLRKALPTSTVVTAATMASVADYIMSRPVTNTFTEVRLQNRELLDTLAELRSKQDDLLLLTQELEDTNRGVVALYAEIAEKAERLRQADVYKDEFLATLAHELRNPLAPIRNAVELMRRAGSNNSASHRRAQEIISRQVDHLARLVDDLLDVARISKGKVTLRRVPVELHVFINAAVETIQPFIDSRRHLLSIVLPPERAMVYGDPVRLTQIVGNLLNNAAKYTLSGGEITLTAVRLANGRLRIVVKDNGIGLSEERIGTVFALFAQGDTAPDRAQDGLGIGLSLVKQLVGLHDGNIWVESAGTGKGSSFIVELPLLDDPANVEHSLSGLQRNQLPPELNGYVHACAGTGADAAPDPASSTTPDDATDNAPNVVLQPNSDGMALINPGLPDAAALSASVELRILLVDDNVDSVQMTAMLLESHGHLTFTAHDADSAHEAALRHVPDLILLDIGLPGADGYQVARMLREHADRHGTTLIAVTGYGTEEDRRKAMAAGFDHHLVKPVEIGVLIALVASVSQRRTESRRC